MKPYKSNRYLTPEVEALVREAHEALNSVDPRSGTIVFNDDFAPSYCDAEGLDPKHDRPVTRAMLYNDHMTDLMDRALSIAIEQGLPPVPWGFPLATTRISREQFAAISAQVDLKLGTLVEGDHDWLAVVCYLQWVVACHSLTEFGNYMFFCPLPVQSWRNGTNI